MKEGFIQTKQGNIGYLVYGENKEKTPLLVVHGGPGFLSMPEVVKDFSIDRPVYFYDQLGSGKSDRAKSTDDYSADYFVNELVEVREKLKLSEVILLGFSWGCGLICSYLLERKPTGVKAVILSAPYLSSPRWHADQRENITKMSEQIREAIEVGEKSNNYGDEYQAAMMEYYKKHVYRLEPWPDYLVEAMEKLNMDVYLTMWGPSEFTISGKLKAFDLYNELHKITMPVLLTCGDMDEAGVKTVKDFQMAFPNACMAVLPKASHLHQIEQPQIYKAIVNEFIMNI